MHQNAFSIDEDAVSIPVWTSSSVSNTSSLSVKGIAAKRRRKFSIRTPRDDDRHGRWVMKNLTLILTNFFLRINQSAPNVCIATSTTSRFVFDLLRWQKFVCTMPLQLYRAHKDLCFTRSSCIITKSWSITVISLWYLNVGIISFQISCKRKKLQSGRPTKSATDKRSVWFCTYRAYGPRCGFRTPKFNWPEEFQCSASTRQCTPLGWPCW